MRIHADRWDPNFSHIFTSDANHVQPPPIIRAGKIVSCLASQASQVALGVKNLQKM